MGFNTTVPTVAAGASYPAATYNTYVAGGLNGIQAAWTSWTPVWSSGLTVGNGTQIASYLQVGKKVTCRGTFTFGSTSAVTAPRLQFPIAINSSYAVNHALAGSAFAFDSSATGRFTHLPICNDSTTGGVGTAYFISCAANALVAAAVPMTWATGDILSWSFTYEAA